jgi:hypothetical protein
LVLDFLEAMAMEEGSAVVVVLEVLEVQRWPVVLVGWP